MRLRLLIALFICFFLTISISSQNYKRKIIFLPDTISHSISKLHVDTFQNLIIELDNRAYLSFNGYRFKTDQQSTQSENNQNIDVPGTITSSSHFLGNRYYSTSDNGLWVQTESGIQKWFYPETSMPDSIAALSVFGDQLFILAKNGFVFEWNESELELSRIHYEGTLVQDIASDHWGNLWLGHEDQLTRITFKEHESDQNTPIIFLNELTSSLKNVPLHQGNIIFKEATNYLNFKLASTYLTGSTLEYQYQIRDEEWSDYSLNPNFVLPYLSTGSYEFRARVTSDRIHYGYTETYPFQVNQSIWNSWWPYIFGSILGLGVLWWISNRIQKRQIQSIQKEKEKIILENQLLQSEQKTMQLQMNPHFLFNALNGVSGLIATGDAKAARKYLGSFSQMMRSLLDQSREDAISIKDEISFLKYYLSLEQMCRNHSFSYEITVDETVDLNHQIPNLLIQPIVENAVIHGMKAINKNGQILIKLSGLTDRLIAEIDDNGIGFNQSKKQTDHKSVGLQLLQERIQTYSKFKKLNPIKILDKSSLNLNATGTIVTLEIPFI